MNFVVILLVHNFTWKTVACAVSFNLNVIVTCFLCSPWPLTQKICCFSSGFPVLRELVDFLDT